MVWQTIQTKNAIVNGTHSLIRNHSKYFLPKEYLDDVSINDSIFTSMVFRRLIRLRPFVAQRKMVRDTYTDYLRQKFKVEDYPSKRSILFPGPTPAKYRNELWNSLIFVIKSTCHLPETKNCKYEVARDNTLCRQILKNILTMEYQKHCQIYESKSSGGDTYSSYRLKFDHIKSPLSSPSFTVIGEFDRYVLYLNELLHTRL